MRLPEGFLDGAEVILSGHGRAALALAAVVAAVGLSGMAPQGAHTAQPAADGQTHFSLMAHSPGGDKVRLVGSGSEEAIQRLQAALDDYARDGDKTHLRHEALADNAAMSVSPLSAFSVHDSKSKAMAAITTIAFAGTLRLK